MSEIIDAILRFLRSIFGSNEEVEGPSPEKTDQGSNVQKTFAETYYKKTSLLSTVENNWYQNAIEALGKNAIICPKVRAEDVVGVQDGLSRSENTSARNRVKPRHFDFVICNRKLDLLAVVEIDDSSHNTKKGKAQDELKNSLCEAVSLPMIRFRSNPTATQDEIREAVLAVVRS